MKLKKSKIESIKSFVVKNKTYLKLSFISFLMTLSLLIVMPEIHVKFDSKYLRIDSYIGGWLKEDFKKGLDINGGVKVVVNVETTDEQVVEATKLILEKRVNLLGVSEPYIVVSKLANSYRIIIELPGVDNLDQAVELVGQTAQLKYKQLKPEVVWNPTDPNSFISVILDASSWEETGITGADMRGAEVVYDSSDANPFKQREPSVQLQFTPEGRMKFGNSAKANVGKPLGLFFDDNPIPISYPTVSADFANGLFSDPVINGNFSVAEATNLAIQLKAGALPATISIVEQRSIGATFGEESLKQSLKAGLIGLGAVALFLIIRYRLYGVAAVVALLLYTLITLALYKLIPVVITLPGIAGFVLSIGMATDANILIFERIKEELRWGKTGIFAIDEGFKRAWTSIRDSNVSSLITCFILFNLGTGPVKGFALTLALGIVVSIFTATFVVRTLIEGFRTK